MVYCYFVTLKGKTSLPKDECASRAHTHIFTIVIALGHAGFEERQKKQQLEKMNVPRPGTISVIVKNGAFFFSKKIKIKKKNVESQKLFGNEPFFSQL